MSVKNYILPIPLASIDSSTFTGSYQAVNASGTPQSCMLFRIINGSNKDVTVSYDGSNDHEFVPAGQTLQFPVQSNSQPNAFISLLKLGTVIYVKGSMGSGSVYLSGYYQPSIG